MLVSACVWTFRERTEKALTAIKHAGFDLVDLRPDCWQGVRTSDDVARFGLSTACIGLGPITMAPDVSLDLLASTHSGRAIPYLMGALDRGARLGATWAYITSPTRYSYDAAAHSRSVAQLSEAASKRGVKLCIEPSPGRALSTAADALRFVETTNHPNLYCLLDLGHCLLTGEDPAAAVRSAGSRLGYVHMDDNDGQTDRHWPLFQGVLTSSVFEAMLEALDSVRYEGPLAIELSKETMNPIGSLIAARDAVEARWRSLSKTGSEDQGLPGTMGGSTYRQ